MSTIQYTINLICIALFAFCAIMAWILIKNVFILRAHERASIDIRRYNRRFPENKLNLGDYSGFSAYNKHLFNPFIWTYNQMFGDLSVTLNKRRIKDGKKV